MNKQLELCSQCAAKMADVYRIEQLRPATSKVFCALCRRKRYGAPYLVKKKWEVPQ